MKARRRHARQAFPAVLLVLLVVLGCSTPDPVQPVPTSSNQADQAQSDQSDAAQGGSDSSLLPEAAESATPAAAAAEPTLADQEIASVTDLKVGEQIADAQGNLISVYGYVTWSEPFAALSDAAQAGFPFFADVEALGDPGTALLVLDVGMCSAGLDVSGFGTAEFFVHASADEVLSADRVLDRGILTRHPVVTPGFDFPTSATCNRGWLPVLWSGDADPSTARYVLTTRESAAEEIERHVYQWDLSDSGIDPAGLADVEDTRFGSGQEVTFNDGVLSETTVTLRGWAELIGLDSPVEGTRVIGVAINWCPSASAQTEFGVGVDGWNVVMPLVADKPAADQGCFDEWFEFAIPLGGVPSSFFVSDGLDATNGYAEWSLENAAIAAPQ